MANDDDRRAVPLSIPPGRKELVARIEQLPLSADAKAILRDIADVSVSVGERLVAAGREVIAFALELARQFPQTTFGLIVGLVLASLIASIPLLGSLLGPLFGPLMIALGIGKGAIEDMETNAMRDRVDQFERAMSMVISSRG